MFFEAVSWMLAGALVVYGLVTRTRVQYEKIHKIAQAPVGQFVRIVGRIVDGGTLVAPITGRACVSYDAAVIEQPPYDGPRRLVARGVRGTPFVIDDGTGKLLVDPRGAFIRVVYDHSVEVGAYTQAKVADPEFLPEVDPRADLRFDEGVLAVGELVAVTGLVSQGGGADDDPVYRRLAATSLRLTGSAERAATVSELGEDLR